MARRLIGWRARAAFAVVSVASIVLPQHATSASPSNAAATAPTISVTPSRNLGDGGLVIVAASGLDPGTGSIAQCDGPPGGQRRCSVAVPARVSSTGSLRKSVAVRTSFADDGGGQGSCGEVCWLEVRRANVTLAAPVSLGPARLVVADSAPLEAQAFAWYRLIGFPGREARVAECVLPLGDTLDASDCAGTQDVSLDTSGSQRSAALWANADLLTVAGARRIDCRVEPCVIAGFSADGEPVAAAALRFRSPLGISLAPADGLIDGDAMTVTVNGLPPSGEVALVHCMAGSSSVAARCERPLPALRRADSNGLVRATLLARQRLTTAGGDGVCRASCTIAAVAADGSLIAEAPYVMASPSVSVTPATGLTDGQLVTVAGSGLQPSYAGPLIFLPTGGWSLAQCDMAVGTAPNLTSVLQHCSVPPAGGQVQVSAPTSTSTVAVRASIPRILGGTTDCTASEAACVIGLFRWEQDGTVTSAFVPLSFA